MPNFFKLSFINIIFFKSFKYVDSWPKILLFRNHHLWNSTTKLILQCVAVHNVSIVNFVNMYGILFCIYLQQFILQAIIKSVPKMFLRVLKERNICFCQSGMKSTFTKSKILKVRTYNRHDYTLAWQSARK